MNKRVVITGVGVVSNIGIGKIEFWNNLINGSRNISKINFDGHDSSQYKSKFVALVNNFNFNYYFKNYRHKKHLGKTSKFALVSARLALEDAKLKTKLTDDKNDKYIIENINTETISVILGIGGPIFDLIEENYKSFIKNNGPRDFSRLMVANISNASPSGHITNTFGIHGINYIITAACASSNIALLEGYRRIASGIDDIVISGGADAFITPSSFGGFDKMGVLASKFEDEPNRAYKPFDKDRNGMILAEASGILILESLEHALKRNARIYCEFANGSASSDAHHIYRPHTSGDFMVKAMQNAIKLSGICPDNIDYINAHGSSTRLNDPIESQAYKKVFSKRAFDFLFQGLNQ